VREPRARPEAQTCLKAESWPTLSNELRTPMNIILGWLDPLARGMPVKDPAGVIATIQRHAQVQAKLIDDRLDMTRLVAGTLKIDLSPIDVGPTLRASIQGLQPAAE